jgi:hypothetical protein
MCAARLRTVDVCHSSGSERTQMVAGPIKERLGYSIAKLAHKSIYSEDSHIKLKQHV